MVDLCRIISMKCSHVCDDGVRPTYDHWIKTVVDVTNLHEDSECANLCRKSQEEGLVLVVNLKYVSNAELSNDYQTNI